jgi:hypothetical protein
MRLYFAAVLVLFTLPQLVRADMVTPGFTRVPRHLIVEAGGDYSAYRFWLISTLGDEPLELVPAKPCRIDGRERTGDRRFAYIIAVPTNLAERWVNGLWRQRGTDELPPGVLFAERIDFHASVPFYDSRTEVVDTYRLELIPGESVNLVWLGQNEGDQWLKVYWAAGGIFALLGLVALGFWVLRRSTTQPKRGTPGSPPASPV